MPNPEASSTPANIRIRGRKATPKDCFGQQQIPSALEGALESTNSDQSDSESSDEQEHAPGNECTNKFVKYCLMAAVVFLLAVASLRQYTTSEALHNCHESLEIVQKQFPEQDKEFWPSIAIGLQEIVEFKQPRVIVFLYKNDSQAEVENIVERVSKVATCDLSDCSQEPIDIEGSSLNPIEIQEDFGQIVTNYREKLDKSGVFIIRNLELVPGKSAQALHLLCDEYHPVVKRALFLFTVKVAELPDKYTATKFLENVLLEAWNDLGVDDKFYPLFARISGTVLSVRPE